MTLLILFTALLLATVALGPVAGWARLPLGAVATALGFGAAWALGTLGIATDVTWPAFSNLILSLLIPVLLFDAALNLSLEGLRARLGAILWLGIPGFLLSAAVLTLILHGLPPPGALTLWAGAWVAGVLIACTDVRHIGKTAERFAPVPGLRAALEGEAVLTQVLAILLFASALQFVEFSPQPPEPARAVLDFFIALGGGLVVGALVALVGLGLMFTFRGAQPCAVITLAAFLFTHALAVALFHVSWAAALATAGLILGAGNRRLCHEQFMQDLWAFGGFLSRIFVFLLVGLTLDPVVPKTHWMAMGLAVGGLLLVRALLAFGLLPWCTRQARLGLAGRTAVFWGGQHGAMNLALALALPPGLTGAETVQAVVYGVVAFSLLVQAPTLEPLLRLLGRRADGSRAGEPNAASPTAE